MISANSTPSKDEKLSPSEAIQQEVEEQTAGLQKKGADQLAIAEKEAEKITEEKLGQKDMPKNM